MKEASTYGSCTRRYVTINIETATETLVSDHHEEETTTTIREKQHTNMAK